MQFVCFSLDETTVIHLPPIQDEHLSDTVVNGVQADLAGVQVIRLNQPLGPNFFNFMGKFMKNQVKC